MKVFLKNKDFRQLTINQWISTVGDTIFYLAFLNYISDAPFAPVAILFITISETLPQVLQIFIGSLADFQNRRILKCIIISFLKILLYTLVTIAVSASSLSLLVVSFVCVINFISDSLSYFSGAMSTPIFIKIIGEDDLSEAIDFRQSTINLVRTTSNILGAVLLGFISIQFISLINVLTFVVAFFGILLIKNDLIKFETVVQGQEGLSLKSYFKHFIESSKILLGMDKIMLILWIISISQAVISITVPISTLLLSQKPFFNLHTGQALALLSSFELIAVIIGNMVSGYLKAIFSTKSALYASIFVQTLLLLGFASQNFWMILVFSTFDAFFTGIISPRLQELIFKNIPEESMGAISSSIGAITVVLPSLLTIALVAIATSFGVVVVSSTLLVLLCLALAMLHKVRQSV